MTDTFDVLIIGGGISGISLAARLAGCRTVAVVEAEEQLGTQATGRSAALLVGGYGPPSIRRLTAMSRAFFETPPDGFGDAPLARRRGGLNYGGEADRSRLRREFELASSTTHVEWLEAGAVLEACPLLKPAVAAAGFLEPEALDLDTHALLQGFARRALRAGAAIVKHAPVRRVERRSGRWLVTAGDREIGCGVLVDAAGAWADLIAEMAGMPRLSLQPMRRSAATLAVSPDVERMLPGLPFASPVDESFYFKPEARSIMVSLADETPSEACDAYPDDLDIALALARFHEATIVLETRPTSVWAGLRTFAPDRNPVVGFTRRAPDFFWYAGQGGYGIQTSPALSELAAKLILGKPLDEAEGELAASMCPDRFAAGELRSRTPGGE